MGELANAIPLCTGLAHFPMLDDRVLLYRAQSLGPDTRIPCPMQWATPGGWQKKPGRYDRRSTDTCLLYRKEWLVSVGRDLLGGHDRCYLPRYCV